MVVEKTIIEEATIRAVQPTGSSSGDEGMAGYLLAMLGVLTLLYLLPYCLLRSSLYDRVNPSFYARPLNYAFKTAGENADVLLFGDSTALLGIDPSQMSAALGVKVLNLVNTQPSLVVNDDMSLRHYLQGNRPPRLIVFYLAPWDFDYGHVDFNARPLYEGEELLVRHGTSRDMLAFARKHPQESVLFPLKFYAAAWQLTIHRVVHANQDTQLAATHGHVYNTDATVLMTPCQFPQYLIDNVRFSWVRDLAKRYRSSTTQILFYVAPVPSCSNVAKVIGQPYDQLPAVPPKQIPTDFFTNDVRFIHPRPFAVPQLTQNLIDAVGPLLESSEKSSPASSQHSPQATPR